MYCKLLFNQGKALHPYNVKMWRFIDRNKLVRSTERKSTRVSSLQLTSAAAAVAMIAVWDFSVDENNNVSFDNFLNFSDNSFRQFPINNCFFNMDSNTTKNVYLDNIHRRNFNHNHTLNNQSKNSNKKQISYLSEKKNDVVQCESSPNQQPSPPKKKSEDITFRKRRLTLNDQEEKMGEETTENKNIQRKKKIETKLITNDNANQKSAMRIKYSTEFDHTEQPFSFTTQSTLMDRNNIDKSKPPFSSYQVGTYSCHGIEPHPYIVRVKQEPTNEEVSFFDRLFGTNSSSKNCDTSYPQVITIAERKINQDRGHVIYPYAGKSQAFFGTYDGHGEKGEQVAEYTMNAITKKIIDHPLCRHLFLDNDDDGNDDALQIKDIEKVFQDAFKAIDQEVENLDHFKSTHSGSTACCVLLRKDHIYVSNVGDSRAVLARYVNNDDGDDKSRLELSAVEMSKDQNAHDDEEFQRVIQSGAFVTLPEAEGLPARIWLDEQCSQIGLAMSRSIGDHALKDVGVISQPVVKEYIISDNDEFFIVATDGVWEFISSTEAVLLVQKCFDEGMGASDACKVLIKTAMNKWQENEGDYRDDVTAIVVRLRGLFDEDK